MKHELLKWKGFCLSFETELKIEFLPRNNGSIKYLEKLLHTQYF